MKKLFLVFVLLVIAELYWLYNFDDVYIYPRTDIPDIPQQDWVIKQSINYQSSKRISVIQEDVSRFERSTIEDSSAFLEDDDNDGWPGSDDAVQALDNSRMSQEDLGRLEKHRLRHEYNSQKYLPFLNRKDEERVVIFVHFHKAGGTSLIHLFQNSGYQSWNRQNNGIPYAVPNDPPNRKYGNNHTEDRRLRHANPWYDQLWDGRLWNSPLSDDQLSEEEPLNEDQLIDQQWDHRNCQKYDFIHGKSEILQFWRYTRTQFDDFLRDGRGQNSWPHCLPNDTKDRQPESHTGVEFISLEWNFFVQDHFFDGDYLRQRAKIDLITVLRDPYDRFLSNFYYSFDNPQKLYDDPIQWAHLDLIRKRRSDESFVKSNKRRRHPQNHQYGEEVPHSFYFSVNYNKPNYYTAFLNGLAENTDDPGSKSARFDFEYFAFGLNETHLEIAKRRLESFFDAVIILERPETYGQLDPWFAFSGETAATYYPHRNKGSSTTRRKTLNFTREEFYRYNALDKKLYEFALELSLSKKL